MIQELEVISFDPLVAGLTNTVDFDGFFSHDLDGAFFDYCGPLSYELAPDPCDHFCLSGTILTLDTESSHAGGVFSHTLKVFLRDYPSVTTDVPLQVEIIPCTITGHYADSIEQIAVSPSQTDATFPYTYSIGGAPFWVPFTFDEITSS